MKIEEYNAERRKIVAWSRPDAAGKARAMWRAALSVLPKETPVFTVDFGRVMTTLTAGGVPIDEINRYISIEADDDEVVVDDTKVKHSLGVHIDSGLPAGCAPTNKMVGSFRIPCGVVLLVAGGGLGKTPIAHALAGAGGADYEVLRFGEPLSGYICDEQTASRELAGLMNGYSDIVLDSVKDVLALAKGGAMKSGLSRGALPLLSRWGSIAASIGCTLYIPVNPSTDDEEVSAMLIEAAKSNSTSVVYASSPTLWHYESRCGEGMRREKGDIVVSYNADGEVQLKAKVRTDRNDDSPLSFASSFTSVVKLSDVELSDAIRKSRKSI